MREEGNFFKGGMDGWTGWLLGLFILALDGTVRVDIHDICNLRV